MLGTFKIASRNLLRYKRRTLLTMALVTSGMVFVLVFVAVTGSFRDMMIGQITDSFLGHVQIHQRGYVASIDNLPLNMNLSAEQLQRTVELLEETGSVEAYSSRLKFGAGLSNFQETTNIRINGVEPDREFATCPLLTDRIVKGPQTEGSLARGKLLLPVLLAQGMGLEVGDTVVLVATNREGSVNGGSYVVGGVLESATGPGGRDGYMHIEDARELLRITNGEASELAIRISEFRELDELHQGLEARLAKTRNEQGKPLLQAHTWAKLSPFSYIADMIDVMNFFVELMLVSVVLISIMNVMIMAVYERVQEIGTLAAIGTLPRRIMALHVVEGLLLGLAGALCGAALGALIIAVLNISKISFSFGRQQDLLLAPSISPMEVLTVSALVVAVAVIASLQPAWRASRMLPVDALRHV